jgi:serine protease Do
MVKRIIEDLITDGKVTRGWLGVQIQDLNSNMIKTLDLQHRNGALISHVIKDSPAEDAGVEAKDVVVAVDGQKVDDSSQLKNLISSGHPNDKTKLTVIRDGKEKNIIVTLGTRPGQDKLSEVSRYGGSYFDLLGLNVENNENREDNSWLSSSDREGVIVVEVKPNSIAEENSIHRGDIIIEIGKTDIKDVTDYESELEAYTKGDTIMLRILRGNIPLYIAFEIK